MTTEYAKTIDYFDDLVDPRTLAHHCLGPEPSFYVLRAIEIEEKSKCSFGSSLTRILFFLSSFFFFFKKFFYKCFSSAEMTMKFNQEMYAKMRARKNEPLSNLRKRVVRVMEKGTPITLVTSIPEVTRTTSPATSVEEITPRLKR